MVCLATAVRLQIRRARKLLINCEVVNYEVVLSDGVIVNANAGNNANLFWALKGGGPNFGKLFICSFYFTIAKALMVARHCH